MTSPSTPIPVSALLLGIGVLGEVIHIMEYAGMGCIFVGLIVIDGRALNKVKQLSGRCKRIGLNRQIS